VSRAVVQGVRAAVDGDTQLTTALTQLLQHLHQLPLRHLRVSTIQRHHGAASAFKVAEEQGLSALVTFPSYGNTTQRRLTAIPVMGAVRPTAKLAGHPLWLNASTSCLYRKSTVLTHPASLAIAVCFLQDALFHSTRTSRLDQRNVDH